MLYDLKMMMLKLNVVMTILMQMLRCVEFKWFLLWIDCGIDTPIVFGIDCSLIVRLCKYCFVCTLNYLQLWIIILNCDLIVWIVYSRIYLLKSIYIYTFVYSALINFFYKSALFFTMNAQTFFLHKKVSKSNCSILIGFFQTKKVVQIRLSAASERGLN